MSMCLKKEGDQSGTSRGPQFVLFMQITTFSTCKTKPNLEVKAKKAVCITSKLLLFNKNFFGNKVPLRGCKMTLKEQKWILNGVKIKNFGRLN